MTDMLVKLYDGNFDTSESICYQDSNIKIKRALAIDTQPILSFVRHSFNDTCQGWADECQASLFRQPTTCFIATYNSEVIGFCCYDGTAKGMIGPLGVSSKFRKLGIASLLLQHSLQAMKYDGYAYAVIGWVSSEDYYKKVCNATVIPDSFPGVYRRMAAEHDRN